jgi:hypothetical protein
MLFLKLLWFFLFVQTGDYPRVVASDMLHCCFEMRWLRCFLADGELYNLWWDRAVSGQCVRRLLVWFFMTTAKPYFRRPTHYCRTVDCFGPALDVSEYDCRGHQSRQHPGPLPL